MALCGAVICLFLPLYLLGIWGRDILCSGILFYKTRVRNSMFILFLTCLQHFPLRNSQSSGVSCGIVCVHQVAELLYLSSFASMWVLGITSLLIITKGDAMVFIILCCAVNLIQNPRTLGIALYWTTSPILVLPSLKMLGMRNLSYERNCWCVSFAIPSATANLDLFLKLH